MNQPSSRLLALFRILMIWDEYPFVWGMTAVASLSLTRQSFWSLPGSYSNQTPCRKSLERVVLSQFLARGALLKLDCGILAALQAPIKSFLLEIIGKGLFGSNPCQSPFGDRFWHFWQLSRSLLKVPSGNAWKRYETAILGSNPDQKPFWSSPGHY